MTTTYDIVAYPSLVHSRTHPDRLAVFATLHGLRPPPVRTARVLEIGCGEGLNVMAFAAAYPEARFEGFDLAETAIARGRELLAASGLDNIELLVRDVTQARHDIEAGSFDYIVAHGLYAWVPEPVRVALLDLIGHALSPDGVAYVSYNAQPGGYFRMAMRDMLLHEVGHIEDPAEKLAAARAFCEDLAKSDSRGHVAVEHMRLMAQNILDHHENVLFHDELGAIYAPQSLTDVVRAAEQSGLRYLCDAEHVRLYEDFLEPGEDDHGDADLTTLRKAQSRDYREASAFRMTLLVRDSARPSRRLDPSVLEKLWISTIFTYDEKEGQFVHGEGKHLKLEDPLMNEIFHKISAARPGYLPCAGLIEDDQRRTMFLKLFWAGHVGLHTGPAPFVLEVGERPETSPLVRAELVEGRQLVSRLDHRLLSVDQPHVRALFMAADGRRTVPEIAAALDGVFPADEVRPALNAAAHKALMRA